MNESETRAEYIDPMLKASGWGDVDGSKVLREFRITDGKIMSLHKVNPTSADRSALYTSFTTLKAFAEDPDAFIKARL